MRKFPVAALAALCIAGSVAPAAAEYPERTITIIIPTAAGGSTDIGARLWAPYLGKCLGEGTTTAVVNMPGATGQIAFAELAKAPADGYTLGVVLMPNLSTSVVTNKELQFGIDSFDYLGNLYGNAITFSVRNDSDLQSIDDLLAKTKDAPLNVGVGGIGNDDHLLVLGVAKQSGSQVNPIPLDGGAGVRTATLGGHVDVGAISITSLLQYKDDLRGLAVATPERVAELPDVPTFREKGIDVVATSTHVIGAPHGLPDDVRTKLGDCITAISTDEAFNAEARERSMRMQPMTAEEATAHVKSETETFQKLWDSDPWM